MENNKKTQQNYARGNNSKACSSTESNRKSTELQVNKAWPRNSRHCEQTSASRNDPQRNPKQSSSAKLRSNVDKRPRPRGGGGGGTNVNAGGGAGNDGEIDSMSFSNFNIACATDDFSATSTGLATMGKAYNTTGGAVAKSARQYNYELNSVFAPGSKKHNLNHLLNFHYTPHESDYPMNLSVFGRGVGGNKNRARTGNMYHNNKGHKTSKKHIYNKEQFLQANFQFVIKLNAKPQLTASPDTLIDWDLIEQINIQTTEEPQCPICLYPPIAAKMTRCGHAYCWPCILHYLALSDKKWRKCPICYEAINIADLKSTTIVQQQLVNVGEEITFQLMRRKKGSMFIEKYAETSPSVECFPLVSSHEDSKYFSKFLLAKRADILDIIERERHELLADVDIACPEYVFIQQALDLLNDRRDKLGEVTEKEPKEPDAVTLAKEAPYYRENIDNEVDTQKEAAPQPELESAAGTIVADEIETTSVSSGPDSISNTISISGTNDTTNGDKYYYFYQSIDGQNIYLHPLNVKMLQAYYGTLDRAPTMIQARIFQKEHHSMDEEHRRKFTCLGHLPLTCQFAVVEVDLQPPIVPESILKLFKNDLLFRKKERQRREREEHKREKRINEINDRQMGKLIAGAADLKLGSSQEFPSCGFDEFFVNTESLDTNFPAASNTTAAAATTPPSAKATTVSYSAVAVTGANACAKPNYSSAAAARTLATVAVGSSDSSDDAEVTPLGADINFSDVFAEAFSQMKQQNSVTNNKVNKKNKKGKKMVPLFSAGMNFTAN